MLIDTKAKPQKSDVQRPVAAEPRTAAPVKWWAAEWPADLQERSYLTNGICGEGTDQMGPGPAVPQFRNNNQDPNGGSAHLDPEGDLVVLPNTVLPPLVPFEIGK